MDDELRAFRVPYKKLVRNAHALDWFRRQPGISIKLIVMWRGG